MPKKVQEPEEPDFSEMFEQVAVDAATRIVEEQDMGSMIREAIEEKVRENIDEDDIKEKVSAEVGERLEELDMDEIVELAVKEAVKNASQKLGETS